MVNSYLTTNKKIRTILAVGGFLLLFFIAGAPKAEAATSTVRGAAWLENYGGIYFNCLDDVAGDRLDVLGNLNSYPEPLGFHFYVDPCRDFQHAVYIDADGNFSGEAWNSTLGPISFAGTETPPENGYGPTSSNCLSTCNASNDCWACYDEETQKVYGYARVDVNGEWIRLDSELEPPVKLQSCDLNYSVFPGYNIQPGDFVGYASSSLGSLSFNCESETGGSACATRDYKIYIINLTLGNLSAPNWSNSQACNSTALGATLGWCKKSGTQVAYEVVVDDSNFGEIPDTSIALCWSGIQDSSFAEQYNLPSSDPTCGSLAYNTNYYWWVRGYEDDGSGGTIATDWYQYNTNSAGSSDGNPDGNALTFTTYLHEFPSPYFTWAPFDVLVGTSTIFNAITLNFESKYYTASSPWPQSCSGTHCLYLWDTTDTEATNTTPTLATTSITFTQATGTTISLQVKDEQNYYCSTSTTLRINYELPLWREVKAK